GEPTAGLPPLAFVSFLQTHDQVGNRAFGERLDALADPVRVEALLACLLLAPHVPMFFMGEEFAASSPFLYFCDFHAELASAVTAGRRAEFAGFPAFADADARAHIPDPNAFETFAASKLRWEERSSKNGANRLALVSQLLALRRAHLEPHLAEASGGATLRCAGEAFVATWQLGHGVRWTLRANFADEPAVFDAVAGEQVIYRGHPGDRSGPASALPPDGVEFTLLRAADDR
ncbi:MAG: DUF3459 domain-containing protein, partial [Rhizobiales bacterium]|nr:DUF3459 domain-containing protein [Rhizobacter sp.]